MTKTAWAGAIVIAGAAIAFVFWLRSGPDPSAFADLAQPRIAHKENERMLVVKATGDPNAVAGRAFKLLFSAYYQTPGMSKRQRPPAPRARWARTAEGSGIESAGRYALPVPQGAPATATGPDAEGRRVELETWEYGDVAEVLHVGPYSDEAADIRRLEAFIEASGYCVTGEHEEEYVRGPGMFFAGDPQKYLTIIRLRIAPAGPGDAP